MKKQFDVVIEISFHDRYMVAAETEEEAEEIRAMFLAQSVDPNTPVLDWTNVSFSIAREEGQLECGIIDVEKV